jgi:hypothetical protein
MILLCNINNLKSYFNFQNNLDLKDKILFSSNLNILFPNNLLSVMSKYNIYLEETILEPDVDKFLNKMFNIIDRKHEEINQNDFCLDQFYIILPFHLISKKIQNIIFVMKNFNNLPNDRLIKPEHILSVLESIITLENNNFSSPLKNVQYFLDKIIVFDLNEYFSTDFYKKMIFGYKIHRIRIIIEQKIKIYKNNNNNVILIITYTLNNLCNYDD